MAAPDPGEHVRVGGERRSSGRGQHDLQLGPRLASEAGHFADASAAGRTQIAPPGEPFAGHTHTRFFLLLEITLAECCHIPNAQTGWDRRSSSNPGVATMRRRTSDLITSSVCVLLAVLLLVAGQPKRGIHLSCPSSASCTCAARLPRPNCNPLASSRSIRGSPGRLEGGEVGLYRGSS